MKSSECRKYDIGNFVSAKWIRIGMGENVPGKVVNSFADMETFWDAAIGSEEPECLVMLDLQSRGYYLYSSTIKLSTGTVEASLVAKYGSYRAYPQVKRNVKLDVSEYEKLITSATDRVYLFTTSEDYGSARPPQVERITRKELEEFMQSNRSILPETITVWLDLLGLNGSGG